MAVASAEPYASHLHFAPDRQPRQHLITPSFLQAGCPSCRPTNSVKALKADHCIYTAQCVCDVDHVSSLYLYVCRCLCVSELFLSDEAIEQLHDFEEECLDAYFHEGERKQLSSIDERIRLTTDRLASQLVSQLIR